MIPFSNTFAQVIGLLFPAYYTYKSLKNDSNNRRWLQYWTILSLCRISEIFLVPHLYTPYYYDLKLLFIIWLQHPTTNGAEIIYNNVLKPFLDKNEEKIDNQIEHVKTNGLTFLKEKSAFALGYLKTFWQRQDVQNAVNYVLLSISNTINTVTTTPAPASVPSEVRFEEVTEEVTTQAQTEVHTDLQTQVQHEIEAHISQSQTSTTFASPSHASNAQMQTPTRSMGVSVSTQSRSYSIYFENEGTDVNQRRSPIPGKIVRERREAFEEIDANSPLRNINLQRSPNVPPFMKKAMKEA